MTNSWFTTFSSQVFEPFNTLRKEAVITLSLKALWPVSTLGGFQDPTEQPGSELEVGLETGLNYSVTHKIRKLQTEWHFLLLAVLSCHPDSRILDLYKKTECLLRKGLASLSKMIPKLQPSWSQGLWLLPITTLAVLFPIWITSLWLMKQLGLALGCWSVRLSHTPDLYLELWPGDYTKNGQWSSLVSFRQLQMILPH